MSQLLSHVIGIIRVLFSRKEESVLERSLAYLLLNGKGRLRRASTSDCQESLKSIVVKPPLSLSKLQDQEAAEEAEICCLSHSRCICSLKCCSLYFTPSLCMILLLSHCPGLCIQCLPERLVFLTLRSFSISPSFKDRSSHESPSLGEKMSIKKLSLKCWILSLLPVPPLSIDRC
ncbi:hypothetical protein Goshw_001673, partial [Gossypium schwendimanii]|nr:hypothetical protein [Gossypium schwendimanii]